MNTYFMTKPIMAKPTLATLTIVLNYKYINYG